MRLKSRAQASLWPLPPRRARKMELTTSAHREDASKPSLENSVSMHTCIYTTGLNPSSVRSQAVEKPSAKNKISAFTCASMSTSAPSSAHRAAARASGPRETCVTTRDATSETSKSFLLLSQRVRPFEIIGFHSNLRELKIIVPQTLRQFCLNSYS